MEGWIKIHRSIINNWIFSDEEKFRAWIIILLTVNYESKKVNIGNLLLTCNRGESLLSLDSWAKLFGKNWNKSKVRRFFDLLQNDSMIILKNEQKTTRLTVCKYDTYQDIRNANETQVKRKRNASETQTTPTKESKEIKESKEYKSKLDLAFLDFEKMRNKIKKPMTDRAKEIILNKLSSYTNNENIKIKILEQSIEHNWTSIFPLKENNITTPKQPNILVDQALKTKEKLDKLYATDK